MTLYPTELAGTFELLPNCVDQTELNAKGLYVVQGLTHSLAEQLPVRSQEPAVLDFTPNDYIREDGKLGRFFDVNAAAKWISKGRFALPLITADETLIGMAWMGPEKPDPDKKEPKILGAITTFAIRLYEGATGDHNCLPYTNAVLDAHREAYENDGVWLEAWGDNPKALKPYGHAGFVEVARIKGKRHGKQKERVYMTLGELNA